MKNIYRAIKTNLLTQKFGRENTVPALLPLYESLGLLGHDGWDWIVNCKDGMAKHGGKCEEIYFDTNGSATISYIQKDDTYGFGINLVDEDGEHKHCFWHFDIINPALKVGDKVESGDLLGVAGNTGKSTAAHLHRGLYRYGEQQNGYHGAIDIAPFYIPIFIKDLVSNLEQQVGLLQKIINLLLNIFKK